MAGAEPTWAELHRRLPPGFEPYALELEWDRERLWSLDLPAGLLAVSELSWQLARPWWRDGDRYFCVRPSDVLATPDDHPEHLARTLEADLSHPLDVTWRGGRWFVLDRVHRLLRAAMIGAESVRVRKVPAEMLPLIARARE